MSPSTISAEDEWLTRLKAMQAAISEIGQSQQKSEPFTYNKEAQVELNEISSEEDHQDIWDIYSEPDDTEDSSDLLDGTDGIPILGNGLSEFGLEWLTNKCTVIAARSAGLSASELQNNISALLASDAPGRIEFCRIKASAKTLIQPTSCKRYLRTRWDMVNLIL